MQLVRRRKLSLVRLDGSFGFTGLVELLQCVMLLELDLIEFGHKGLVEVFELLQKVFDVFIDLILLNVLVILFVIDVLFFVFVLLLFYHIGPLVKSLDQLLFFFNQVSVLGLDKSEGLFEALRVALINN